MPTESLPEGWGEYRKLVLAELERLSSQISKVDTKIDGLRIAVDVKIDDLREGEISRLRAESAREIGKINAEIAVLKFKSGLWGAAAGLIPAVVAVLYVVLEIGPHK